MLCNVFITILCTPYVSQSINVFRHTRMIVSNTACYIQSKKGVRSPHFRCLFRKNKKGTVTGVSIKGNGERSTSLHTEINFKPQAALFLSLLQKSGILVRLCAAAVPHQICKKRQEVLICAKMY